jgi:putative transposase
MILSYQYRWYPTEGQKKWLACASGCSKLVYNIGVKLNGEATARYWECIRNGIEPGNDTKLISRYDLQKYVSQLKKTEEYAFLNDAPHNALNYAIKNFGVAQKNYFDSLSGKRKGEKLGKPKAKKFDKDGIQKISFAAGGTGPVDEGELTKSGKPKIFNPGDCYIKDGQLKIPGISRGALNIQWHRPLPADAKLKEVHVSKNLVGAYYIALVIETEIKPNRTPTGKSVGVDLGIADYAITSDGEKHNLPETLKKLHKKVKKLSSKLSKAKNGSKRQKKLKKSRRKTQNRIANIKNNALNCLSKKLVIENDIICTENLAVKQMLSNKRYAPAIHKLSWGEFSRQLRYKAENSGVKLIAINRYFASSPICNKCNNKNQHMNDTRNRILTCTHCGHTDDRDINAAKNILREGLRST